MVKGIILKVPPKMNEFSELEILSEIDVLNEYKDKKTNGLEELKEYDNRELHICIMTFKEDEENKRDSMMKVVGYLSDSCPELIKSFLWEYRKVVIAFPSSDNKEDMDIYRSIVEELLRFTTYCLAEFEEEQVISMIKRYISLFIKW